MTSTVSAAVIATNPVNCLQYVHKPTCRRLPVLCNIERVGIVTAADLAEIQHTRGIGVAWCCKSLRKLAPATATPLDQSCDGCNAEPGEPCRPGCLSAAE